MKFSKTIICIILVFIFIDCKRDKDDVPYYYVNFKIFVDHPQYSALRTPGNSMILTAANVIGDNDTPYGVIVYRLSLDEFKAYGRTCPHNPSAGCAVEVDTGAITAVCPCCSSEFLLMDGYPSKGVADMPLNEYHTSFNGTELAVYSF